MDDKELTQLAAKAAGIDLYTRLDELTQQWTHYVRPALDRWNPLTDDGDALRLAVELRMEFFYGFDARQDREMVTVATGDGIAEVEEHFSNDPRPAVRRAIVRAAAALVTPNAKITGAGTASGGLPG